MKYQFVYLNIVTVCFSELDSVCVNGRAGQGKPSRRWSKIPVRTCKCVRIFKCSYRTSSGDSPKVPRFMGISSEYKVYICIYTDIVGRTGYVTSSMLV